MFRADWSEKPSAKVWRDIVRHVAKSKAAHFRSERRGSMDGAVCQRYSLLRNA
jgi:hypothetical protein